MPKISLSTIKKMYEAMILGRLFDARMFRLQRQGRLGTFAPSKGHEAIQVGAAFALKKEDWVVPYFREHVITHLRGVPIENILQYYAGDERGHSYKKGWNVLPVCIPVSTQLLHAVGLAWAFKKQRKKAVVLAFLGDGATSAGDFHEALNFSSVFNVPVVFICENNQYAISVPVQKQTASTTLSQKAIAYAIPSVKLDGNDLFAVYKEVKKAIEGARKGLGPSFLECFTYRLSDHTTSDDASKYRSKKEVTFWESRDPIIRVRTYLEHHKVWNKNKEGILYKACEKKIDTAVKKAEHVSPPNAEDIFKYTFKALTQELQEEMEDLKKNG